MLQALRQTRTKVLIQRTMAPQMLSMSTTSAVEKPMYKHQSKLPRLPVQDLKKGMDMYLHSIKPLVTTEQFNNTQAIVADFIKPGGLGEELHRRLLQRAAQPELRSWLIDWWNDWAYMSYRDPIVINVSYFFQFKDDKTISLGQTGRAAAIIQAALKFRDLVNHELVEPDKGKDGPLDMDQYRYMFNTSRRAHLPADISISYAPEKHQHVTVIRKNRLFSLPVYPPGSSTPYSTNQLKHQLDRIVQLASDKPATPAIGLITTEDRDVSAKLIQQLIEIDPSNKTALEAVESSIFAVCLDDSSPVTRNEVGRALWHGDGRNRFFEKSVQFIVFANGKAGLNGEHSMMDATPTSRLSEYVMESLVKGTVDHGNASAPVSSLPEPTEVKFHINSAIEQGLNKAAARFDQDVQRHDHHVLHYEQCGKNRIKKFKLSPDGFAQMAIQLAYYRYKGKFRATYESAQVKKFLAGRTEVVRSCSVDSAAWVLSMQDPNTSASERLEKLRKAVNSHVSYMNQAVEGLGCDRLILGMRLIRKPGEDHPFFNDFSLKESSHWYLSTSQISSEHYDGYGWGEVCPDGFGLAYMVNDNVLNYNIANLREWASSKDMADALKGALDDMCKLCEGAPTAKL